MIMIKVFKTDVQCLATAADIITDLLQHHPDFRINFDLADEDRILRVEGYAFSAADIADRVRQYGHYCIDLPIDLVFLKEREQS
jgi:hypothetical protein